MSGLFITFEGVEGCGKTTQIDRLHKHLVSKGHRVEVTREPGGVALAEAIRGLLLDPAQKGMSAVAELLLYEAARAQHVSERIKPALDSGAIVLCDRFADSTTAYQGAGRLLYPGLVAELHHVACDGVWPRRTYLLDVPVEEGLMRRARQRSKDRIENEPLDFHQRVRDGFLLLAKTEPERIHVIDGLQDAGAIATQIAADTDALLARR
jgi:dTMP kinase